MSSARTVTVIVSSLSLRSMLGSFKVKSLSSVKDNQGAILSVCPCVCGMQCARGIACVCVCVGGGGGGGLLHFIPLIHHV